VLARIASMESITTTRCTVIIKRCLNFKFLHLMMHWPYSPDSDITTLICRRYFTHIKTFCVVPVHPVGLLFAETIFKYSITAARTYKQATTQTVKEARGTITLLNRQGKTVAFQWVLSHVGIHGNETAHLLPKKRNHASKQTNIT
jgi:hypothetical protein